MEETVVFKQERFNINKDVYFTVEIAYFDGHPIAKTKSLKLYYHRKRAEEMGTQTALGKSFMKDGLNSQFAVNLVNYLCRLINKHDLYHVYAKNVNAADRAEELPAYISHENQTLADQGNTQQPGSRLLTRFTFSKGLLRPNGDVLKSALDKTRDEANPEVISSFEALDEIPIWGYVHPRLLKNREETVHVCHLAFILERLVHNPQYPEFNNQAAMSLLLKANEAKETNQTLEHMTEIQYKAEIERLRNELNGVTKQRDDVIAELRAFRAEANTKFQASAQREQQLLNEVHHANVQRDEIQATLNETQATLNQEREVNTEFRTNITLAVKNLGDNMSARLDELRDGFNATVNDETTRHNVRPRILCLYRIERLEARVHHAENEIVLDSFCGLLTSEKSSIAQHAIPFMPNVDECIFRQVCGDALDVFDFVSNNVPTTIARTTMFKNERKLIVVAGQLEQFKLRLRRACKLGTHHRNAYANFINEMKDEFREEVHEIVHEEIAQAVNEVNAHIDEQAQAIEVHIDNAVDEIEEHVDEELTPIVMLLYQLHPNTSQVFYNHAYRDYDVRNGRIYCQVLKNSNQFHELTEEEIHKLRFK